MQGKNKEAKFRPRSWQSALFPVVAEGILGNMVGTELLRLWKEEGKLLAGGG